LKGERDSLGERPLFWHFPAYLQSYQVWTEQRDPLFRSRPCSIIRLGDWKLHEYFEDGGLELYNLRDDIGETTNLADTNPRQAEILLTKLRAWRKEVNAPVPTKKNPAFDATAEAAAIAAKSDQTGAGPAKRKKNGRKKRN
jgi:arylsulfatase A-like enzyme